MTLPTAIGMDDWLNGYVVGYQEHDNTTRAAELDSMYRLRLGVLSWLRAHNDRTAITCPNLPDLERRYSVARTTEAKREALRALLAARDAVIAAKPAHDAVQAQAVMPLQLGLHPTGIGGEE